MNMSYCRFQNTSSDLQDCMDQVDTMAGELQRGGLEELKNNDELNLGRDEENALREMIEQCRWFCENAEELLEEMEDWKNADKEMEIRGFHKKHDPFMEKTNTNDTLKQ